MNIVSTQADGSIVVKDVPHRYRTILSKNGARQSATQGGWIVPRTALKLLENISRKIADDQAPPPALPKVKGVTVSDDGGWIRLRGGNDDFVAGVRTMGDARWDASSGFWKVPGSAREDLRSLLSAEVEKQRSRGRTKRQNARIDKILDILNALDPAEGLEIGRIGATTVLIRLTMRSTAALKSIQSIPGIKWISAKRSWQITVKTETQAVRIRTAVDRINKALAREFLETSIDDDVFKKIYPIEHAPELFEPIRIGANWIVFENAGKLFKLNDGHGRKEEELRPFVGLLACVFYGRLASISEIPDD